MSNPAGREQAVAALDVGSSAVKGVVLSRSGEVLAEHQVALVTQRPAPSQVEQDPQAWWQACREVVRAWQDSGVQLGALCALSLSGQMQDLVLTRRGTQTGPAILYSDTRAELEADELTALLGADPAQVTGNPHGGASILPKLLWLKRHRPQVLLERPRLHIGAKDVVIERLCGAHVTDHTAAATTGLYHLESSSWMAAWLPQLGLDLQLPALCWPTALAGRVHAAAAAELGLPLNLPVLTGIGDAGATALGAGQAQLGERHVYLGTSGFIGVVTRPEAARPGVFRLPLLSASAVLAVAPLTNAGSVWRWAAQVFAGGDDAALEDLVGRAAPARLLCLPYLAGERSPVDDPQARGVYLGIGSETGPGDLARAALEGVAYALRATAEPLRATARPGGGEALTLLGGGSRSPVWCQIVADVLGTDVLVPQQASLLPVLGSAYPAFASLGWSDSLAAYRQQVLGRQPARRFHVDAARRDLYTAEFGRFQQLYPVTRPLFHRTL
ncbi:xylulokinase [Deinococcus alpinitundrae]|uniref:xylulokinase n=1 Tax=Deinococcus alpinitundrae TaxID=468913 RepID=UPI00137AC30A|nr:FGGY family carbohydrate kinase [Deinococcus alpinitundrae]